MVSPRAIESHSALFTARPRAAYIQHHRDGGSRQAGQRRRARPPSRSRSLEDDTEHPRFIAGGGSFLGQAQVVSIDDDPNAPASALNPEHRR